jgi:hypothetical protein
MSPNSFERDFFSVSPSKLVLRYSQKRTPSGTGGEGSLKPLFWKLFWLRIWVLSAANDWFLKPILRVCFHLTTFCFPSPPRTLRNKLRSQAERRRKSNRIKESIK